ncbi:hypothetical protein C8E03_101349 [Lachnotalea glycerini]|uniref:DUF7852 domain-containing protein n=1 Tax=Lachnotalea glycerini TaxID=1763509 RepID=A0A318ERY3_9FIRM|nr:hypothetical protein [Lachnotalea glycerini]PXV95719.1 hypothetical protein C8E03_101349 [Lachnotalea glycerini]
MMNSMNKNVTNNVKVVSTDAINTSGGNECNASVINADTLTNADNYPCCGGDFKIPKVLTEFIVQIDTESVIKLNEPAYEIKRIEKQVFLTQCRYIPPTDKVFLEGYIRKNIEYATRTCSRGSAIGGSIKDTTVHIPFKVYTKVNFKGSFPQISPNLPSQVTRYFDQKNMGKNFREADRSNIEIFNEPVYCELEWSAIFDADIDKKGNPINGLINEEEFNEFTDKSVLYLCMKLLQKQQICCKDSMNQSMEDFDLVNSLSSQWNLPITEVIQKNDN